MLSKQEINEVFLILEKYFSKNSNTDLKYFNHYQLLVAIILSAQATDNSVNKITKTLFEIIKTPKDTIKIGFEQLNKHIKSINYHNTKSKHIIEMSNQIINNFNNKVPDDFNHLISLHGVGRKTANLFLSIAHNKNYIAVDTHVFRTTNKIGIVNAKNRLNAEKQLMQKVPIKKQQEINSLFIQFGRKYCTARKPNCYQCPLNHICKTFNKKK